MSLFLSINSSKTYSKAFVLFLISNSELEYCRSSIFQIDHVLDLIICEFYIIHLLRFERDDDA